MAEAIQSVPSSAVPDAIQESTSSITSTINHDGLPSKSRSDNPIAHRACTPLGLFIQSSQTAAPMRMPHTLTPESTQSPTSSSDRHNASISTSPTWQSVASPTRTPILASDISRKCADSIDDKLHQAATMTNAKSPSNEISSPTVPHGQMAPLHTATALADTKIHHPKPIARTPLDVASRPGTASSVAQLERTAQQLSMTSSIDDAIRDLHSELKRSDSRRSQNLAASVKNGDDIGPPLSSQIKRHLSSTSSIVSTNIAARQGGYSPAAFVMSPSASMTGRLTTGPLPSAALLESDSVTPLSRHGPGKSSESSARSARQSLADISESEPALLPSHALEQAGKAPPTHLEPATHDAPQCYRRRETTTNAHPNTDTIHQMTHGAAATSTSEIVAEKSESSTSAFDQDYRPSTSQSHDTYHQAQNAFIDFDGVHCSDDVVESRDYSFDDSASAKQVCVPVNDFMQDQGTFDLPPLQLPREQPFGHGGKPKPCLTQPVGLIRPQSYIDATSGVQMNYYPARVPAALKIPQKLSNRPKANQRNSRQSKVLTAMMQPAHEPRHDNVPVTSATPALDGALGSAQELDSVPMKERHHERRPSFLPMSTEEMENINQAFSELPVQSQESTDNIAATLRIPKRISEPKVVDKRKSRMSLSIPAQLRASAYFDSPAVTTDIKAKDGSAMNALDDILDASANAPVRAFTDHLYAGKLGPEVYGIQKRKSMASSLSLKPPSVEQEGKRQSSLLWPGKRSNSYNSQESAKLHSVSESQRARSNDGNEHATSPAQKYAQEHAEGDERAQEEERSEEEREQVEEYMGGPTTLLAELQLRKQQQKDRIQNRVRGGNEMQATLLELDAIAETQRMDRKSKRVTLAWEDTTEHVDQNGSDDENVPLAIIAARQQGAKNMADLERPLGLIEKREIEENEPLSQRRARLQGLDKSFSAPRPQSMLMAPSRLGDTRPRQSMVSLGKSVEEEVEGETLAERRRRMAAETEKKEVSLPPTRPVSVAFSAELLSQFDVVEAEKAESEEQKKETKAAGTAPEEEETLGQRRRRLQAEKIARQKEMAHGNPTNPTVGRKNRHMSLANVLSAHPKKSPDVRVKEAMQRLEEEERLMREQDAKMAAMRVQMPSAVSVPGVAQPRGFQGGVFNNGNGGLGGQKRPVTGQFKSGSHYQQGVYLNPRLGGSSHALTGMSMHGGGNGIYGGMQPNMQMQMQTQQMQVPMPHNGASMDRVEVWRQGVYP